jgi:lactoylglutathione lyase
VAEWEKQIGAINLIVGDLERSKAFYRDVFGLPLQHEDEDSAMFRFTDIYVFLQRGAAHRDGTSGDALSLAQKGVGQFVIFVDEVDEVHAELDQAHVATISGPADRDWGMRTLTLADPGGYTWEITQELPSASGPGMTPEEARVVLRRSRELRFLSPSSFGGPLLQGEAPSREDVAAAVALLTPEEADELAANAWRLWMTPPADVDGGRRFVEGRTSPLALYGAGLFAHRAGDIDESQRLNEAALDLADAPEATALAHLGLSRVAAERGDADEALRHALEAREAAAPLGESIGPAPLHVHATALWLRGDFDQAAELFEQSLAFNSRIGDHGMVKVEQYNLGFVNLRRGDTSAAILYLSEVADNALAAAALAVAKGDRESARELLDQVAADDLPHEDRAEAEWLRSQL